MLFDAHCHLQDPRLSGLEWDPRGAVRVVNGTQESDWEAVAELAARYPSHVIPSFGLHPWYAGNRTTEWQQRLEAQLDSFPHAGVGETGLDRWIEGYDLPEQEKVFRRQLELGAQRNRAVSIHCLKAWGRMLEILQEGPRPERGFLLHSFGGPSEMIEPFVQLGAYFSFPGYYLHERKERQREVFCKVPIERLLVETDAPDQLLPEALDSYASIDEATGKPVNHPGNLRVVYRELTSLRSSDESQFEAQIEDNWCRLFSNPQEEQRDNGSDLQSFQ